MFDFISEFLKFDLMNSLKTNYFYLDCPFVRSTSRGSLKFYGTLSSLKGLKMQKLIILFFLFLSIPLTWANQEKIPNTPVKFTIQSYKDSKGNLYAALNYENYPHWHTYWINPGDAGLPIKAYFYLDDNPIQLEALEWPAPKRFVEKGDVVTYGYSGRYTLFYRLKSEDINKLKGKDLTVKSNWLVCKHICIPGEKTHTAKFDGIEFIIPKSEKFHFKVQEMRDHFASLPKKIDFPPDLDIILAKNKSDELSLFYNYAHNESFSALVKDRNFLIPFPLSPFDFHREKLFQDKKENLYGKMKIEWDGEFNEPPEPLPADGVFKNPYTLKFLFFNPISKVYEIIERKFSSIDQHAFDKSESFFALLQPVDARSSEIVKKDEPHVNDGSFLYYLLFAFLGGLLLNIMPCVLPVISLKIFYLIKHRKESKSQLLRHNIVYSLGVLFTFTVLALLIVGLKSTGELVGWGFQLQSPTFLAAIIFILFVLSLNLFGLYHFVTPGGKFFGNIEIKEGLWGDFLSGILTTILATPCSAPFLGTALTFAFTSSNLNIFVIFLGIGLGLAFPFLLVGFFPRLITFLPKPGLWMEKFKKLLGLSLILTVVWLLDVLVTVDPGPSFLVLLGSSLALIFFAFYIRRALIFFAFYIRRHITKNKVVLGILFVLPIVFLGKAVFTPQEVSTYKPESMKTSGLPWEKWSPMRMDQLKNSERFVFIDFTAKWCLTCKVNEKLVLNTDAFKSLVKDKNIALLLADWTKRDQTITNWLFSKGKVGVPAYFIINKDGEMFDLGETISIDEIKSYLK
jgi:thiol:disulfide interchange protein DsbD